jgi:methyl-accepting chemotaxis protein
MKIKVFAIVCIGAFLMLGISSALIYTQVKAVQGVTLDPLADSLHKENSKVLVWILSSIPVENIDTLKLPESWAEIFVVNNSDLQMVSSTSSSHKGIPLYRHPQLLDQGAAVVNAIKARAPSTVSTKDFMIVIQPTGTDQSILALKPKAWENSLVSKQNNQIKSASSSTFTMLGIFLIVGGLIGVATAFVITIAIASPTKRALNTLEALSLGDFDQEIIEPNSKEMKSFNESYLRLKTSLEMALERISRR